MAIDWASKREREREETSGGTSDGRDRGGAENKAVKCHFFCSGFE